MSDELSQNLDSDVEEQNIIRKLAEDLDFEIRPGATSQDVLAVHTNILRLHSRLLISQSKTLESHSQKLESQSKTLESQSKTLESHSQKLESQSKTLESHSQKLESQSKTLESHTKQLEVIASTVLDNADRLKRVEDKLEKMPTDETIKKMNEAIEKLDEIIGSAKKKDQEMTMMGNRVKRVEEKANKNEEDIGKIKPLVGLAQA